MYAHPELHEHRVAEHQRRRACAPRAPRALWCRRARGLPGTSSCCQSCSAFTGGCRWAVGLKNSASPDRGHKPSLKAGTRQQPGRSPAPGIRRAGRVAPPGDKLTIDNRQAIENRESTIERQPFHFGGAFNDSSRVSTKGSALHRLMSDSQKVRSRHVPPICYARARDGALSRANERPEVLLRTKCWAGSTLNVDRGD